MTDWVTWDGSAGGRPDLPLDTVIVAKFKDGDVIRESVGYWYGNGQTGSSNWDWRDEESDCHILEYRVEWAN